MQPYVERHEEGAFFCGAVACPAIGFLISILPPIRARLNMLGVVVYSVPVGAAAGLLGGFFVGHSTLQQAVVWSIFCVLFGIVLEFLDSLPQKK